MNSNNDVDMAAALIIVLGRGGRAPRRRRGPLGVPALGHRLPRAPVRQPTAGTFAAHAGDRARRPAGARAGRRRHRRHRHRRPLLVLPVGGAARRAVLGLVDRPPADPHRRPPVRRRAVEQLRDARHRHGDATTCAQQPGEKGLVWANGGYATKHAFGVYCDRAAGRAGSATATRRTRSTPCRAASWPSRRRRRGPGDDRGVHGDARPRGRTGAGDHRRACSPTAAGRGARRPTPA